MPLSYLSHASRTDFLLYRKERGGLCDCMYSKELRCDSLSAITGRFVESSLAPLQVGLWNLPLNAKRGAVPSKAQPHAVRWAFPLFGRAREGREWDYLLSSSVQMAMRFQSASLNMSPTPCPSALMRLPAMPYLLMRMVLTASARSRARRMLISGLPSGEA